ncbi:transketolase [Actinoallomurus vinaceus]|uniref:Transketolase n=1 Tax=Actinoallomurus vinaceus TaxID=1080074 RepID=A0ABP8U3G9_9ACTN
MLTTDDAQAEHYLRLRRRLADGDVADVAATLAELARQVRQADLAMIRRAGLGHIGSDFSVIDILVTLYGAVMSVDPRAPLAADRDRLILSKGHTAGALYAVLAQCGFFAESALETFAGPLSPLNGHPNRTKVPGVETNTGPLGHGFPVAVGVALASRLSGSGHRTFVILGDGELQEGSNWEAAMTAGHHRLSALTAVVDRNMLQQGARTEETKRLEPLADKWISFGWDVRECDGHDHRELLAAFAPAVGDRPVCVIAHTTKGKGVSFMEDRVEWHHKVPSQEQATTAFEELAR